MDNALITGFHQITLDEYLKAKAEIAKRLNNMADDYIAIGYLLRQIRDSGAYTQEGYISLNDFAKKEYGLSESAVSRFIAINVKFSIDGYSDKVLPEYKNFGSSKLSEMLTLPDEDCKLITEITTVATIRDIKKFNKEEKLKEGQERAAEENINDEMVTADIVLAPETKEATKVITYDELSETIIEFFRNEKELLNEIYSMSSYEDIAECINPSGSRTFKKGIHMLFMYDYNSDIVLKTMGKGNTSYTWQDFIEKTVEIYKDTYTDHESVWQNYYERKGERRTDEQSSGTNDPQQGINDLDKKYNETGKEKEEHGECKKIKEPYEGNKEKQEEYSTPCNENEAYRNVSKKEDKDTEVAWDRLPPKKYYKNRFNITLAEGLDDFFRTHLHLIMDSERLDRLADHIESLMNLYGDYTRLETRRPKGE